VNIKSRHCSGEIVEMNKGAERCQVVVLLSNLICIFCHNGASLDEKRGGEDGNKREIIER